MARRGSNLGVLRLLLTGALSLVALAASAAQAFTQELYVWQRACGPAVQAALGEFAPRCDGFNVLAAEVTWRSGTPHITRTAPDFAALGKLGRPVGLSLRVGAFAGPFAEDDAAARALAALAAELLTAARRHGLEPKELQIDFDCAEGKLAGYRRWLVALHRAAGETPLVFTALPVWLDHRGEFAALADATDGFVLQVHSLERPAGPDTPFALCDPERAQRWIARAALVGRPFRVALPTYGYTLAFDRSGKFLALAAEGPAPSWPTDVRSRTVAADPASLAALSRALHASPPPHCTGLLWFRLPVEGDRLNWHAVTLAAILRGETPTTSLVTEACWSAPGLVEIVVRNTGQTSLRLPTALQLAWPAPARPDAGDALAAYTLKFAPAVGARLTVNNSAREALLPPGGAVKVAWLRFTHEVSLQVTVVEAR